MENLRQFVILCCHQQHVLALQRTLFKLTFALKLTLISSLFSFCSCKVQLLSPPFEVAYRSVVFRGHLFTLHGEGSNTTLLKTTAWEAAFDVKISILGWCPLITSSFLFLQEVSHSTSMMLEDLTHLSTLLESILGSEKLIPLKINIKNPPLDSA